ncbi:microtubule-actin cross-linking factor 1 isoform X20 [Pelobates cultripes]|uniref:Microtubule-actin cross-linking factor 1 isoform X20 n=1 Tax=Pelobates cultripes TaxID=61616 RepID=A0AAD1R1U6_PELCU|nr:microtubule-actin cross-linking factor 1 isoform X20 [Pelobates cultripes]
MSSSDEETLSERSYRSERSCRSERSGSLSPCPPGDTLPWNLPRHEQKKRQSKDSVLDPAERAVVRVADERDRVQKKTFTKWVNKHLIKVRKHINDLYEDLRDGHNLISLLEVLSGVRLPREKGRMRFHRLQNVQIALDFLKQRQVKLVNIRNDDITDGNPKLTLGLIWTIILHFQISEIYVSGESGDMSAKEKLLLWTQKVTAGYTGVKCTNFSASWRDGKMFNAIIHRYRPDLVDMQKVNIQSNQENLEQAFEIAESLGVTRLLDAEDVDVDSPDEKSVITYVSSIYDVFPKVPEGTEGISATEVDSYWLEYQERIVSLTQWIRQHVLLMSDKSFPQNPVELKALYNQYVHVKETEIPVKEQEKGHIQKLYQMLQPWIEFGRLKLPPLCHPNDVEEQWGKLILSMLEREKVLRPAVERLELLLQIANRIQNGCLSCEEKLTLARNTLQSDADNVECGQRVQQEIEVVQFLQESEGLLRQLQADVQILRDEKYFQVEELAFRVLRIQDELFSLRLECTNLYRRGNFSNSDLQPSISENTSLQQTLHTTHTSSTSWFRKPMSRMELVALSSSEDEGSLRFVYELLAWVEEMQMKLERAEWGNDLPSVEAQLENQRQVHNSVEELALSLREARSYEVKMSPNFRSSYRETLNKLEIQYSKLGETSSSRLHHLQSLHDFVSRATAQIIWLNEKEEEELAYDWSDLNSNMAAKKDYFNKLTQELDEKQDVIQSLQETAEMLSLKNHPAKQTVEAYSAAVLSQWQWVQQLCLCVEQHVKENSAYFQFFSDVHESEVYLRNMQDSIKRKYSCDRSTSVNRLEDMLQDSMDEKEQLIQSRTTVASLVGRSKYIVQLKPRNPEYGLSGTLPIRAICDYRQIEITINRNEECVLEDHSQRTKWKVISTTGNEAMVPSVCFLIPSPNKEAIDLASRVEQLYQKVMSLWHQLHVNTKSLISWHYLRKDLDVAQSWNIEKLRVLPLAERLQTLSSLHSHLDDFLEDSKDSQIFSQTDRLSLEQEVESCKEQCRKLVDLIETEDKDESVAQTYLSELHNIRLHLDDCEQRIVKRLQSPSSSDADAVHENTVHIAEQEKMQEELKRLKSELSMVSDRCDHFLHKSPSASSTPNVRSQLDLIVGKMDHVYGLSSVFLEKLKTVDVVIRSLQGAESLVKGFEARLSQEDTIPADPAAIQHQKTILQQWLKEAEEKESVISSLEADVARSKEVKERLHQKSQERSLDVEQYQERTAKLRERWSAVVAQLETRQTELTGIREVLRNYRDLHDNLIHWIETTKSQQEMMKPGQSEDRRVLSEQLSQQTALVAEIEQNQSRLDDCQTFSQQYSVSVKDYELQLMTYKAFVESQQKSPMKRRRMFSSSDVITQEFMDLRTRYTALVTLTTQHVKYISESLRRLEEEEKVLEEEKEKHVEDIKNLSSWVSGLSQVLSPPRAKHSDLRKSISEQKALGEELLSKREQILDSVKSMQIFLAKHNDRLSPEERENISSQILDLKETYNQLCDESDHQIQQLHTQLAREAEQKTLQEQQVVCGRELEDLFSWAELTEKAVSNHQAASGILDLSTLQDQQKSMQELHKGVKTQGEQFARALKAAEDFLEENKSKMDPSEVEAFKKKLQRAKEQYHSVLQKTVDTEKQLDLAVSTAVLEETKKSKTAEELKTNLGKIEALLHQVLPTVQSSCQKVTTTDGREPSKSEMSNGRPPGEATDLINDLCDRKKMQHQEMLAQQQNFILTIQSAQDFLDKHGSTLPAEERLQLQNKLACLKEEYATSLSQAQLQLKHAQSLKDELQNFLHDHGEFDTWLQRSEEELNNMQKGKADCEVLQKLLHQQAEFSEDVISHKGDLRYITIAGQKAIEAEKAASEHCRDDFEVAVAGALVKTKLEDASKRYSTLHSKCSKLGSHLNSTLSQFQQFQEGSDATLAWLQDTESVVQKILSEPVASDPETLQTQLEKAKSVQCDLAEHQVQVEKVHKALRALLEVQGEPSPDCGSIQETAESIDSCFQDLSARMSAHSDLLQKSVAQSQSVQEGMDNLLHWLEEMEKTLESQKQIPMSSSSIQESLATNMKLRQDIDRRRGSLDATGEMVGKFMETADSAAAAALQSKLLEVTDRFNKVCLSQSEQEAALKDILPKVERYEQIRDTLEDFRTTRSQLLASGNQPDKDIAQFSEQIQELNTELNQQAHQLFTLEQLASELSTCPMLLDSSDHLQMVQVLKNDFLELQKAAQERERDALSCQDELEHFKRLVGIMRKWLKDNEERVPSAEDSLGVHEIQIRLQQVQDLLQEWDMKGSDMAVITQKGSELEIHIMEITASESQLRGSVLMASLSPVGNVNGYHTCQDLTGIQCDISETSQKYEALGLALKNREEQFSTLLEKMQQVQQEANHMLSWLESKEKVMSAVNVSPTKSEIVKAQAKQNKEFISELEQSSGKVNSLKAALRDLLEKHPNSPEAETWKKTLENLDLQWDRANQVTSERQQKLEESANQLATFQAAGSQLRPWLNEKELMMSVLGPLSIDPNMLNAQKQQVQFMLKEFEARKDQYEELKHAAYGILTGPGDESPFTCQVEEEFHEVSKKWTDLTSRLNSRAEQIDQATVKSTEYQEVLQGLMDKIKLAGKKLSEQPAVSTQPDAVKQQLQETSGIRSDLEILAQEVTEAQVLCTELSALVVEPYLKDELQKRLDTVALPLKGMEDLAADRVNRLQSALANSQQFQQMFDELRNWLDEKRLQLAKSSPVSSKFETLQTLLHEQEEFQKSLNQNSGSYEMIVNEGESLVMSSQPGDEKTGLQNQLTGLKSNWEELVKKATERHSRLKDCLQKAQKYGRNVEDLVPWLEDCEAQVIKMEVTLDPVQLEAQLLRAKALQSDTDKKRSLLDILNNSADLLTEAAEVDDSEILEQKAVINQRMDNITEQLHNKSESIEEMSVRLKELKDTFKNVEKRLEGAKHILEIYATLGPQACSSKNLENMRTHQDMLQTLDPQVKYLKDLIQGLTEDAPEGSDVSHLVRQVEAVEQDFENVKQEVNECCSNMESKLQGIGQFHSNVREMFSQLTDLDDELDNMCPVGRDLDSLKSQTEVVHKFIETLQGLKSDIECSEKKCRVMLENEGGPDLIGLMRELGTLNKQCAKLTERGRNRQEQLQSTFNRVDDFNKKQKELKHQIETAEGSSALQGVVGTEVESIKQQLEDFKAFQKEQVDSLQVKLQQVNGLGQGLIQSADKNCDVHCLEHDTDELNAKWNTLNKKVAERLTQLQEALLHCGKFQDALEPLLSWLTDTEELIANQKPPSAEYKVVKAQIQEQKLLQRLLDDRRATVEMIQAEGVRIADGAEPADQDKINRQLEFLGQRWFSLLQKAQSRQKQLDDILVLAKQFHETTEPIFDWLSATEKKLANSEPIGTQTSKIQQQIGRHKSLEDDITVHETAVCQASKLGDSLSALCSQAEQDRLAQKLDFLQARYSEVQDLCNRKGVLLGQALSNARLFGEDEVEVLNWLSEVEDRLSSVCVKDYKLDALQKQHTDHLALSEEIINRKRNVDQAVKNGQALLKQTTGEEVLLIQEKLDGIKTRYAEITASSGKALRTLEQALQLAGKFQTTHDELTSWLRQVEDELTQSSGQSPAGDQIPQFQQRQKELKKEAMEYRIVLDTINEVGSALLELVPWRAREGLDKLVSDANEQYRSVSTTVGQRVDQIDAAIQRSQQYEQAADAELAWVAETKRKLLALGPICLEQDQTTAQLQVQKAFSVDIIRHKDSIDELLNTQEEILGTCGDGQKASLQEKTEILLQQYEEVSHLNSERYARLEKAQGLVGQFWETYEELNPWIEEMQTLISQLPPPAVDHDTLRQQQEDVRQLRESVSEHKPHIDKLLKIGPLLCELNPEEGAAVREKYSSAEKMYLGIKEDVRKIAMALDDAVAQASQFHDKIGPMLETLENLASRLRIPPLIPAEVEKIRDCISENKNALMELEKLQPSFEALKHRGEELIKRSQGADTDPAAKEIQDKLDQLVFFWEDIKARADEREMKFLDVLELAEKFWLDMGSLLTTIKDTHDIVHDLESPGIDPSMIKQQIEAADSIKEETDGLHEELEFIRILGADLIFACGETEKPEVKKSIDEMNNAWENLKKTWSERLEKLRDAMSNSVQYQDTLQAMFDWLDNAVIKLCDMPPVGTDIDTVKDQLNAMKEFKVEVYQQQIEMEKLNHQGELMLKKAIDDTDRDIIQGPLTELKHLWENLGEKIARRQHKLEGALLALGQFQHALEEVMSWLVHTDELLDAQKPISGDPKVIEVELAKHHVLKNDVLAHESTVQTVNKAGNELLESSARDDANSLRTRLETLNQLWEAVLLKTEEREQQLDLALQQAQGFTGEIEDFLQWQSRIESQLSSAKATGGLPETAREQLQAHMELYAELKAKEDIYKQLLDKGHLMLLSRDDAVGSITEQNVALLKRKWESIANKVEERKVKLEEALALATDFQNSLQEFINWLTQAEQSLNIAPSPSLILDTVLFQIDEHKIFVNEVNLHREQIIELDKTGNQLKFLSQKQDVVLIKNLLLSVLSRWEKVVQRSVDRGRSLDDSRKRAKQFHEAWKKLVDWLEEAENHLDSDMEISNDPDKIKLQLTKHKEFQKTLGSKQPVYDTTVRTGRALKEKALLSDDVQKLDHLLGEVRDKWDTVCGKSVERQHKLEEALLFSGQFMDALQALVDWLYKVEPQLAEDQPVHGDLDLVMNLMDAHKVFQKELGKRTSSVHALKRSARELLESSREDTTWVKVQLQELSTRWDTVCKLSVSKQTRLEQALKQAEEFRSTVHMLLEWLSEAEQTLRFRGALPDDAESLQSLIDVHKEFMKKVEEKHVDVNTAVSMGEGILTVCHPDCITTIKHWITIIRARFEEVLTWGNQHQQRLQAALSELLANSDLLDELLSWIQWAETTLIQRDQEPMPQNIEQVKALIGEHQAFMEEMTQKQPDVDKVTKTYKRKTTDGHGSFNDKTRSRKPAAQTSPPALQLLSQSETKNPRINQLSARWQQVWLLALERQRKLNDALDRLEELKEFANFDFDIWRKKYMRWMNHKKSRVMDFFRRIDKDQDGKITRQEFIDGILASKFPTTKLEMTAVADIFDRDGDGYIDYYEFVAALHPNKDAYRPTTDADKIEDEVTRQVAQCKCAKRFQVEQIGENKYRFFLGNQFGDSQQLRLVRILRSTVMVRVGGGWMALDEFLVKNDPCRVHHPGSRLKRTDSVSSIARGRTNLELREKFILPEGVSQGMTPFRSRGRRSKPSSRTASPTRSSSSASQSNHSCASVPSSPATPASGSKTPQQPSRCYEKPWLVNSKAGTPFKGSEFSDFHIPSCEVTPAQSSKMKKAAIHTSRSSLTGDTSTPSGAKSGRADPKKSTSRAGSRTGSRASSRRGSDASDFDLLETQSACSDTSESSRRGLSKPSKIPTISKKTASTPKTTGSKR